MKSKQTGTGPLVPAKIGTASGSVSDPKAALDAPATSGVDSSTSSVSTSSMSISITATTTSAGAFFSSDAVTEGGRSSKLGGGGFSAGTKRAGTHAILQVAALRSKAKHEPDEPPRTAGAKMTLLATAMQRIYQAGVGALKAMVRPRTLACVALLMGLHGQLNVLPAQTVFVNVNGAKSHYSEILGAKTAAQRMGEPFTLVRPSELAPILERANESGGTLRKLVVSGHSSGLWVSGTDEQGGNSLKLEELQKYKQSYPDAFSKVKLFFGMACNIGTEENSRQWFSLFPNVNAVVGFDNIGPANTKPAAGAVLNLVDAELSHVNWKALTRDGAMKLAKRLSRLPGVNVTEFAVRLRANDGSSVYYSKKNQPTSLSSASDLVDQLRPGSYTAYFEAKDPQFARPPSDHGPRSALRIFYNATQNLLNAMGRDIVARGGDPAGDWQYQRVTAEKEAALRLMYFETVLQNAEHHMRPQIDSVMQELVQHGVTLQVPKLPTLTRTQVIEIQGQLSDLGNYTWNGFQEKHQADIAAVTQFSGDGSMSFSDVNAKLGGWQRDQLVGKLAAIVAHETAPVEVKDAAARLQAALGTAPSEAFVSMVKLFEEGLVKLQVGAFPADWVTTERPRV